MPKKINPFAKYMFSLKKSNPDLSMGEIQQMAGEKWQRMSGEERAKYKNGEDAAEGTEEVRDTRIRYNCLGESIDQVKRANREKLNKEIRDAEAVENMIIAAIEHNELLDLEIYFFSGSYYFRSEDIYPAEIAIAKFSLREGITDVYHKLINPGELPLGAAYTALEHSKKTHRLTLPPNTIGEKNYHKILDEILDFLKAKNLSSECVKPFFVYSDFLGDDYEAAAAILEKIADENRCNNAFRILRAEQFLFSLNRLVSEHLNREEDQAALRSIVEAKDIMRRDNYRYSEIGCDIHNEEDNSWNCALSKVKRWGYSIVDNSGLECIDKIPGQHFPIPKIYTVYDDFEEVEEQLGSILTESFHQMQINSTVSDVTQTVCETQSLLSEAVSMNTNLTNQTLKYRPPIRHGMMRNKLVAKKSDTTISSFPSEITQQASTLRSMASGTNIDDTGESYLSKIVKNNIVDEK